ncbi:hypothetical protein [Limosilactobacillus caccae]|jgi:hypothetical protein|uniref:hypothetical protein n=1 Tax=Limosilactobacillus caccae TaxID=1926284 RepID=UPI0013563EEB|nr:hypothetical protein [Limosilactobacillus caccae]
MMKKEHGQVTGIIWRGSDDLAAYQQLKQYAENQGITVSAAAKQLVIKALKENTIEG